MTQQPEALRLADELDAYHTAPHHKEAAAELRRLEAVNAQLLEALQLLFERANRNSIDPFALQQAVDAITKATGETK